MPQLSKTLHCVKMRNCSTELEASDLVILSALRGATAFLCAVINILLLASVSIRLDKSLFLHRLLVYLSVSSLLALLANIPQAVSAFCYAPWHRLTCVFVGFVNHFTACLFLLVSVWLTSVLSLRYWCPNHRAFLTVGRDVAVWFGVILLSVLVAVIPVGTEGYGLNQAWCWLQEAKLVEQWLLWHSWVIIIPGATLAITITALCKSDKRLRQYYESSRGINSTNQQRNKAALKKIKILVSYIAVYWGLVILAITFYQIPQVKRTMAFLVTMAILEPLGIVAVPVVFVVHLQETRRPSAQRVQGASFQHCDGERSSSFQNGGGERGKKAKASRNRDLLCTDRQEELRESLLLTMVCTDEFDKVT